MQLECSVLLFLVTVFHSENKISIESTRLYINTRKHLNV